MKSVIKFSATLATALAVTLLFALVACSESNLTNADESIAYSEPAPESSSALESSSSVTGNVDPSQFETPCTAENEGKVEFILEYEEGHATRTDRYGSPAYYRCESGSWVKGDITLTCDTANVQIGDACIKTVSRPPNPIGITTIYTYAGDGNWTPDECNVVSGEYAKKMTVGADRKTEYFQCTSWYGWREIDDAQYACFTEFADKDTCVIETGNEKNYYKKELEPTTYASFWKKIDSSAVELSESAEVEESCTKPETKLGDVCSITKQSGNVSFGIVIYTLVCYVYTEEGWVAKGAAVNGDSCEDILNPPADTTAAE